MDVKIILSYDWLRFGRFSFEIHIMAGICRQAIAWKCRVLGGDTLAEAQFDNFRSWDRATGAAGNRARKREAGRKRAGLGMKGYTSFSGVPLGIAGRVGWANWLAALELLE